MKPYDKFYGGQTGTGKPTHDGQVAAEDVCPEFRSSAIRIAQIVACGTRIRQHEIGSGKAHSFNFESDALPLTVEADYSKYHRPDVMQIRVDLAKRIQEWIATKKKLDPAEKLVNIALNRTAEMLEKDLAAARAAWIAEDPNGDERQRREHSSFRKY